MRISFFVVFSLLFGFADSFWAPQVGQRRQRIISLELRTSDIKNEVDQERKNESSNIGRRAAVSRLLHSSAIMTAVVSMLDVQPSNAGEVGAKINAAVTQSDLGVSVRRSVVKGAQVIDKLDGRWEKFSDDFGLGAERSKRDARPEERDIPPLLPLDEKIAKSILDAADATFLAIVPLGEDGLRRQIEKVDSLVRKSFERAGQKLDEKDMDAETFNYLAYVHFKAFSDILIERNVNFKPFRVRFENELGTKLCEILLPKISTAAESYSGAISDDMLKEKLTLAISEVDQITEMLRLNGFVALTERADIDKEKLADWSEDLSDLQFSIALDKDATQNAQLLLGEQGFRLVPDFARFAITSSLRKYLSPVKQDVTTDEYYMDTSYASDPDLFEVKQVLLNIVIESM